MNAVLDGRAFATSRVLCKDLGDEAILLDLAPVPKCQVDSCTAVEYLRASAEEAETPLPDPRWAALRALQAQTTKKN